MAVEPTKARKILIVHGVQTGSDSDLHQDIKIQQLLENRLGNVLIPFTTEMYRYENVNDAALRKFNVLIELISKTPVASVAVVVIIFSTIDLHYKYEALNSQLRESIENNQRSMDAQTKYREWALTHPDDTYDLEAVEVCDYITCAAIPADSIETFEHPQQ